MAGRAPMMMRSPFWKPAVFLSRSRKPVLRPRSEPLLRWSSSMRSKASARSDSRATYSVLVVLSETSKMAFSAEPKRSLISEDSS